MRVAADNRTSATVWNWPLPTVRRSSRVVDVSPSNLWKLISSEPRSDLMSSAVNSVAPGMPYRLLMESSSVAKCDGQQPAGCLGGGDGAFRQVGQPIVHPVAVGDDDQQVASECAHEATSRLARIRYYWLND